MRIFDVARVLAAGSLVACVVLPGCGGESGEGGRDENLEADDDEQGDDDEGKGDDDASDDDASDDDASDVDASDDDDSVEDPLIPTPVAPSTGVVRPTPVATGPIATAPVATITPPAEGCATAAQSQAVGSCNLQQVCASGYQFSSCGQLADGSWSCQCSTSTASYELVVRTPDAPCELVSETCAGIGEVAFEGEPTCALERQSAGAEYCEMQTRCTQAAAVSDVVDVVQHQYRYTSCYDYGDGRLSCGCSGPTGAKNYFLSGLAVAEACSGAALCDPEASLEPAGEPTCALDVDSAAPEYCQRQETCTEVLMAGEVEASVTETRYATCSADGQGGSSCACSRPGVGYSFSLAALPSESATCEQALAVCLSGETPVPDGPIDCAVVSQSASINYCDASLQCTQDAAAGDVTLGLYGSLYTYCQPSGDAWLCQCSSASTAELSVRADDAWGACTEAATQCPERVDVNVGSTGQPCGGYGAPPPVNLPPAPAPAVSGSAVAGPAAPAGTSVPGGVAIPCAY